MKHLSRQLSRPLIPLTMAYLCQDCSVVGNCPQQCPACSSGVLMTLANVLDRKQEKRSRTETRATEFQAWRTPLHLERTQLRSVA
jgi:hypothetical protein